jgi:hypothetical protein
MSSDGDTQRLLRIYLNDHLMGATGGVELARRLLRANTDTPLEAPLRQLLEELVEDRTTLRQVMRTTGAAVNPLKVAAAIVGERAGRLKLNGRLTGYSPLSRLVELEGLHAGANAKLRLWLTLAEIHAGAALGIDLDQLANRARSQLDRLEALRREAARTALSDATGSDPDEPGRAPLTAS